MLEAEVCKVADRTFEIDNGMLACERRRLSLIRRRSEPGEEPERLSD